MLDRFKAPFDFFIASDFFLEEEIDHLKKFVLSIDEWKLHTETFFEQYEYKVKESEVNNFSVYAKKVKQTLEEEFGVVLSEDSTIVFHKLIKDQKISIHNDCPILGYETHRLVINLNADFQDENGGHFYICSARDSKSIFKVIRPIINSGFGFAATKNSFHAIGKVVKGERFSLVFSYYHIGNTPKIKEFIEATIKLARSNYESKITANELKFLLELETNKIKTRKGNLLEHLIDTYCLLRFWGENDLVAQVGLYHSIMGTTKFKLPNEEKAATALVSIDESLYELVKKYKTFNWDNNINTTTESIILTKVYFANLFTGKLNSTFNSNEWNYEKKLFTRHRHSLSNLAIESLSKLYN